MPKGIIVGRWDEHKGIKTVIQYPATLRISDADLIHLYSRHVCGENEIPAILETVRENAKYLSYLSGPGKNYYFILIAELDESIELYEDGFIESLQLFIQNLENDQYLDNIALFYSYIEQYYMLNDEQKLSWLFQNEIRRNIIEIMRKVAVIDTSQLKQKLKNIYEDKFFDIEPILMSLEKSGIIKLELIEKSRYVFFLEDIIFERIPPVDQHETIDSRGLPSDLKKSYQHEVDKFFSGYKPNEEDALNIIEKVILDTQIYESLKLLRVACITREDFEDLATKGVRDVDYILKTLWETNLILVLSGNNEKEYYCLKSDFYVKPFFPAYLLNIIKIIYQNNMEEPKALIREIQILKSMYLELYNSLKKRTDKKKKEIEQDIYIHH